jgi:uncharacterized RDD family membrane protein YckC
MSNPYAPPLAAVQDVVIADQGIVPADRGTRLAAAMVDSIIFMVMVYVPFIAGAIIAGAGGGADEAMAIIGASLIALVGLVVWCWLTFRSIARTGQSMAKKMMGIKVVRRDGSPVSLGRVIWLRNILNSALGIIPVYGIIDILFIFAESRQCLHDKIADTIVVKA